ncbi:unnamed protein product [Nyctereutes procyonoides]|uniref:(raccoon dog) hypothetical protein n=1 Tax=Nyctereutes procyonoides TaxID=34880 RepID=A0A811Y5M7_NYCPR|nr:unnamed protein product [Nyctereutes procyonoides]
MMGCEMASVRRVIQVVKSHTPLISFPDGQPSQIPSFLDSFVVYHSINLKNKQIKEVLRSMGLPPHSSSISQHSDWSKSPDWLMHQGLPDTKNRRELVSQEKIEFVQRGGPELLLTLWLLFVIRQKNSL